jgi:hypothetical protein
LTVDQQQEAAHLVARCAACAALAADLRVISAAVAWEPLPSRRRDFHIDPRRAEQLRGSALQRLMRRLSVPQAGALRPAAAGILSVGLLFMVAGAVWPAGGAPSAPAGPATGAPAAGPAVPATAAAEVSDVTDPERNAAAEAEAFSAADVQAEDRAATGPSAAGAAAEENVVEAPAPAAVAAQEPQPADQEIQPADLGMTRDDELLRAKAMAAQPDASGAPLTSAAAAAVAEPLTGVESEDLAASAAAAAPMAADAAPIADAAPAASPGAVAEASLAAVAVGGTATDSVPGAAVATSVVDDQGLSPESVLMAAGLVLAVAGAILLLLTWLSRRMVDPLLR